MIKILLEDTKCSCENQIPRGKWFCPVCGRSRYIGVKKWEYILGGLFLIIVFCTFATGVNIAIGATQSFLAAPTPISFQIPTQTNLSPSPQSTYSLPSTQSPPPTELIPISSPVPTTCPEITITLLDTPKGDILHVERCLDGWKFDSPPFAKGEYSLAPNENFLIYCTNVGDLYAIRFRDSKTISLENLRKEMPVFHTGDVSLSIFIYQGENQFFARITDRISGQNVDVKIPLSVSQ